MRLRVLLVKCRNMQFSMHNWSPPLGVLYLASSARQKLNVDVRVMDMCQAGEPLRDFGNVVRDFMPHVVGLSGLTSEIPVIRQAAGIVRAIYPDVPVVVGGPCTSADLVTILVDGNIDVAVIGEGEQTFAELLEKLDDLVPRAGDESVLRGIRGIAWCGEDGAVVSTEPRPLITDLDTLPMPAWDTIDIRWFWTRRSMSTGGIRPYFPIFSSRGCPYNCSYCHKLFGKRFRPRSAEVVVEEI
jgi:anaerobic magnesium-protoporphyrin IX monomethyl ester cyclase